MSMITREQTQAQTNLVRERIRTFSDAPIDHTMFRLLIHTMVADGVLHADWFLMVNSTAQLLELEGLVE